MNTFKFESLKGYTEQQIINGFMAYVSNQRYNDKHSVAYFVGMIDFYKGLYAANNKRKDILNSLELLLDEATTSYQPRQIFEGYENQYILILQRGVDPYSPLYQNKYGIGKILGFPNENDVTVTINSRVNVPIQKLPNGGMSVQDYTIQADYFYPSKFFRAGNGFSAFTTYNVGYYSGLDSRTDWKNFENSGNRTLISYNVDNYFNYPTNSGVVLTTSKNKNEFYDTLS